MSLTTAIAPAFTAQPRRPPDEVLAWLYGRLDWEDRIGQLHRERAGSATPDRVRSSTCQPTSTR